MSNLFNIIWIMTDEQRCDSLGCYSSPWAASPAIDKLAAEGTLFVNAITPAPLCVPARTSVLTGKTVEHHGTWANFTQNRDISSKNLIQRFRDAGYVTASFGKSHYAGYDSYPLFENEKNFWYSEAVEPEHYLKGYNEAYYDVIKYPSSYTRWIMAGKFPEHEMYTSEYRVVTESLAWLDQYEASRKNSPFLLRVSFNAPHTPVTVPEPYLESVDMDQINLSDRDNWERTDWPSWYRDDLWEYENAERLTKDQLKKCQYYYYCQCSFVDSQVKRVIDYLEQHDLMRSTIIAFCSDHGTHLGDYNLVQKQTFFEPVVRVPFIIRLPENVRRAENIKKKITECVSTAQLLPTLLDFNDLNYDCDYLSLKNEIINKHEEQKFIAKSEYTLDSIKKWGIVNTKHLRMIRYGAWKLCFALEDASEGLLFNIENDLLEQNNLYYDQQYKDLIEDLKQCDANMV